MNVVLNCFQQFSDLSWNTLHIIDSISYDYFKTYYLESFQQLNKVFLNIF